MNTTPIDAAIGAARDGLNTVAATIAQNFSAINGAFELAKAQLVAKETALASRELTVTQREKDIAERELKCDRREKNLESVRSDLALARAANATHAEELRGVQAKLDKSRKELGLERAARSRLEGTLAATLAAHAAAQIEAAKTEPATPVAVAE